MMRLLEGCPRRPRALVELGLQHEQQHQELLLTDMLHAFAQNPLAPAVLPDWQEPAGAPGPTRFVDSTAAWRASAMTAAGFCFDNETPAPSGVAAAISRSPRIWCATATGWRSSPTAAIGRDVVDVGRLGTRAGRRLGRAAALARDRRRLVADRTWRLAPLDPDAPVRHISWYEADAFARWAARDCPPKRSGKPPPTAGDRTNMTGHVWQWTDSAYRPYPGYRPAAGAVGEYNGKFMINQMVLRGGSLATPAGHTRPYLSQLLPPRQALAVQRLRLARDL